jgi:hypothetical protein
MKDKTFLTVPESLRSLKGNGKGERLVLADLDQQTQLELRPAVTNLPRKYQELGSSSGLFISGLVTYHLFYQLNPIIKDTK